MIQEKKILHEIIGSNQPPKAEFFFNKNSREALILSLYYIMFTSISVYGYKRLIDL